MKFDFEKLNNENIKEVRLQIKNLKEGDNDIKEYIHQNVGKVGKLDGKRNKKI